MVTYVGNSLRYVRVPLFPHPGTPGALHGVAHRHHHRGFDPGAATSAVMALLLNNGGRMSKPVFWPQKNPPHSLRLCDPLRLINIPCAITRPVFYVKGAYLLALIYVVACGQRSGTDRGGAPRAERGWHGRAPSRHPQAPVGLAGRSRTTLTRGVAAVSPAAAVTGGSGAREIHAF